MPVPAVDVIQDGARLHYALPLALQREGLLGRMFTDWFVRSGSAEAAVAAVLSRAAPGLGQRLAGRRCSGLDPSRVRASPWLASRAWLTRQGRAAPEQREALLSARAAAWVRGQGWQGAGCLMGFVRNIDPGLCEAARSAGLLTVVDQMIAPAVAETVALRRQAARWPGWAVGPSTVPSPFIAIERRTWRAADRITCPSAYVRQCLLDQGIAADRIWTIPYPIDASAWQTVDRRGRDRPVTVGFVGAVGLRKGAPAVFELSRRFDPARVRFVMVGPLTAPAWALAGAGHVVLAGAVPRSRMQAQFDAFDVFLLPSACEGSAGSVMEAMASALPVVTTPAAGSLVRDGVEGYLRDGQDLDGLADCIAGLADDPALRHRMGRAGRAAVEENGIDAYGGRLRAMLEGTTP